MNNPRPVKVMREDIRKNQVWVNKQTGNQIRITGKAGGNGHWSTDTGHHIHEGTLRKFYRRSQEEEPR